MYAIRSYYADNIDNYLFPPKATADEKGFYASSCVLLGNNLFAISSHIDNQGKVEILSEEVLLKDSYNFV